MREGLRDLAHRTELMVFDTFFLPEEYEPDWGHSQPDEAIDVGLEAEVGTIALFHHEPHRTDDDLDKILDRYLKKVGNKAELMVASEGLQLIL